MNPFAEVTAVTFDVGGTLIQPWPSVGQVYAEVAARHGVVASPEVLGRQFVNAWRQLGEFHHTRGEWAALVRRTFAGIGAGPVSQDCFEEIYDRFRQPQAWHIYEDVLPALDLLAARGLNLGIISNWDDRLAPLLQQLGLAKYFEAIVISCNVGFVKPSPVIFEHAARILGTPPPQILHVGDCVARDVAGARGAGFQAVHLARPGDHGEPGSSIASLRELLPLLG